MQRRTRRGIARWRGRVRPQRKLPHTRGLRLARGYMFPGNIIAFVGARKCASPILRGGGAIYGSKLLEMSERNARILFLIYQETP